MRPAGSDSSVPAVNIKEMDTQFELELSVPGFDKSDFNVRVENQKLLISAESKTENEKEMENYTRREFGYHSFQRSFALPKEIINEEAIDAKYEAGILKVMLPKRTEVLPKEPKNIVIS
ncbi:MAG TPA: molecular chaperone Hsp20 [Flavobacteriales bacterium]|nr:Hsp20/alpha crystallin family protein [Flavobacteriales bacterium]HAW19127.1 molecular chaperone Hsp20 [Flavobacteriales bacterium]